MSDDTQPGELSSRGVRRPQSIIDVKLPLPWLLSSAFAICAAMATMYFSVDRMREDITELKGSVKVWNGQVTSTAAELALLKFRLETVEADIKARTREQRQEQHR